jgi:hypothetical protein
MEMFEVLSVGRRRRIIKNTARRPAQRNERTGRMGSIYLFYSYYLARCAGLPYVEADSGRGVGYSGGKGAARESGPEISVY